MLQSLYGNHHHYFSLRVLLVLIIKKLFKKYMIAKSRLFLQRFYPSLLEPFNAYIYNYDKVSQNECSYLYRNLVASIITKIRNDGASMETKPLAVMLKGHNGPSLNEIGKKTGTDKVIHRYLDFYEENFRHLRNEKIVLMEIGIFKGDSIAMWEEYFPQAEIIGVDINKIDRNFKRAKIIQGNAMDETFISSLLYKYKPNIFIDDASHHWSHQINMFEIAFPFVAGGGMYICEDVQVCFGDYRKKEYADQKQDSISYFSDLAMLVSNDGNPTHPSLENANELQCLLSKSIENMIFRRHCVVIKKNKI